MDTQYQDYTDSGTMIKASYIHCRQTGSVRGGYVQDCPKTTYKIALRADGSGWEPLYDQGGPDCGIGSDNLTDVIAIGAMDDSCDTVATALAEGASELRAWADRIRAIDPQSEAMAEAADYLDERADDADSAADDPDECSEIGAALGMVTCAIQ